MRKGKRFAEEQIMRILHDAEAAGNVRDVCRQHNIAAQTLDRWRRQWGGWKSLRRSACGHSNGRTLRCSASGGHAPSTIGCCRRGWENTGKPGCQAPRGSVSGADVPRQRAPCRPGLGAAPQPKTAAGRLTRPGRVETAHSSPLGALSTLGVSEELPPVEG